jgi:D-sedoheptulose 7-phosphate isomerase
MKKTITESIKESIEVTKKLLSKELCKEIEIAGHIITAHLIGGRRLFICGNGGSAADAQHIAAEFTIRYLPNSKRPALPVIALTTDTSAITACGNDFGYDQVFAQQLKALAETGDVVLLVSTSGNSENIIKAAYLANSLAVTTIGLLGGDGGKLKEICNHSIVVPSTSTARIQESHILIGHIFCQLVEDYYNEIGG